MQRAAFVASQEANLFNFEANTRRHQTTPKRHKSRPAPAQTNGGSFSTSLRLRACAKPRVRCPDNEATPSPSVSATPPLRRDALRRETTPSRRDDAVITRCTAPTDRFIVGVTCCYVNRRNSSQVHQSRNATSKRQQNRVHDATKTKILEGVLRQRTWRHIIVTPPLRADAISRCPEPPTPSVTAAYGL